MLERTKRRWKFQKIPQFIIHDLVKNLGFCDTVVAAMVINEINISFFR